MKDLKMGTLGRRLKAIADFEKSMDEIKRVVRRCDFGKHNIVKEMSLNTQYSYSEIENMVDTCLKLELELDFIWETYRKHGVAFINFMKGRFSVFVLNNIKGDKLKATINECLKGE